MQLYIYDVSLFESETYSFYYILQWLICMSGKWHEFSIVKIIYSGMMIFSPYITGGEQD